jgi:hypothetical protein
MGALPDYGYSSAVKDGDLVWDRSTLDRFIADPDRVVPGNAMKPYGGLALAEEAARNALEPSGAYGDILRTPADVLRVLALVDARTQF